MTPMPSSPELRSGWIGSLLLHLLALLVLLFSRIPTVARIPEFVEISWGGAPVTVQSAPSSQPSFAQPAVAGARPFIPAPRTRPVTRSASPVALPERHSLDLGSDQLTVPRAEKLASADVPKSPPKAAPAAFEAGRITGPGFEGRLGEKDQPTASSASRNISGNGLGGTPGSNAGSGVGYSIEWTVGGTRRLLSGDIPKYPEGTNIEAQIKIQTVVLPNGRVKSLQPAQRANLQLENAAIKELRLWLFEPLPPTAPQVEQTCVVSFLFRLR